MIGEHSAWRSQGHNFTRKADTPNMEVLERNLTACTLLRHVSGVSRRPYDTPILPVFSWFGPVVGDELYTDFRPNTEQDWKTHVGENLESEFSDHPELKTAVKGVLRELEAYLEENHPEGEYSVDIESDYENPDHQRYVLRVDVDVESVEEWREAKKYVREIARDYEQNGVELYTHVDRIR